MRREFLSLHQASSFVVVASLLCSCAISGNSGAPSQLQVDVRNVAKTPMSEESRRASSAMHSFLIGQLAYDAERSDVALSSFIKASQMSHDADAALSPQLAELYVTSGKLEEALAEIEKAITAYPNQYSLWLFKAGLFDAMGRQAETEPLYAQAESLAPHTLDTAVLLASLHLHQDHPARAQQVLEGFTKHSANDPLGWFYLGRAYDKLGESIKALNAFTQAEKLDSQNFSISLNRLRALLKLNRDKEAKEAAAQIVKRDPQNPVLIQLAGLIGAGSAARQQAIEQLSIVTAMSDNPLEVRFRLALVQIERRNFREAQTNLRLVLAAQPRNSQARYYLASMLAGGGRKREAIEELYKIEKGEDLYVKARTFAAFVLRQDTKLAEAEKAVRQALEVEPDNRNILSYLILILRDERKFEEAERLMRRSVDSDPDNDRLLFNYAILLNDMKREGEASRIMQRVLQINPRHSDALNFLAYGIIEQQGDLTEAMSLIQRALTERPNDPYYLDTLGWIHYQRGEFADAEEILGRAAATVTEDPVIQEHYGDSLVQVGKSERAMEVYRNALERGRDKSSEDTEDVLNRIEKKLDTLRSQLPADGRPARR